MRNNRTFSHSRFDVYATIASIGFVVLALVLIFSWKLIVDRPGQTEGRAAENMQVWLASSGVGATTRKSCSHDSDGDGYASCAAVTAAGEKIYLECVAGWWPTVTGASGCKEIEMSLKMLGGRQTTNNSQTVHMK